LFFDSDLAKVVGANEGRRSFIVKRVWDYIISHNLRTSNGLFMPDANLRKIFGTEPVPCFNLAARLREHVY